MSPAEFFGTSIAVLGMFAILAGPARDVPVSVGPFSVTLSRFAGGALLVTGLLVLTAIFSQPTNWWAASLIRGASRQGIYWFATLLLLTAAAGTVFAHSGRAVMLSASVLAFAAACLAGLVGEWLIAMIALGAGVATSSRLQLALKGRCDGNAASSAPPPLTAEPLLAAVCILLLIGTLGRAIHLVATTESGPEQRRAASGPALPRPVTRGLDDPAESRF